MVRVHCQNGDGGGITVVSAIITGPQRGASEGQRRNFVKPCQDKVDFFFVRNLCAGQQTSRTVKQFREKTKVWARLRMPLPETQRVLEAFQGPHLQFRGLRVRPPGIEWKTGRNPKMFSQEKKGQNIENALGPKWQKNGPKFFAIFGPFFRHFGPRAIFYFWASFFPFLHFGPFSILYQVACLSIRGLFSSSGLRCLQDL